MDENTSQELTSQELNTPLLQSAGDGAGTDPEFLPADDGYGSEALLDSGLKTSDASSAIHTMMSSIPSMVNGKTGSAISPPKARVNSNITDFESHFSLRIPTSTVHFRGSVLRVIDTDQDQIILQQDKADGDDGKQGKILVKRLSPATYAQRFLRMGYTLITILFLGFLFVFCFQVLLFLFIALPVEGGYTSVSHKVDALAIVSTLFSFPVMLYGMASLMAMGSAFVVDTYNGAALFRSTIVEILYMIVFLVAPILTFAICLMVRDDEPWRTAAAAWAILVCITFCVWGLAVTSREVKACFWLVERHFLKNDDTSSSSNGDDDYIFHANSSQRGQIFKEYKRVMKIAHRALLLTQTARYSGEKKERFHVLAGTDGASYASLGHKPQETSIGLYGRLTSLSFCSSHFKMFDTLEPTKRVYSSDEVRDILPFMTKNNWSMQKMWCMGDSRYRNVIVARGPSALTPDQIKFSVFCTVTSSIVVTLFLLGGLIWMESGVGIYILVSVVALLCCIVPIFRNALEMYKTYEGVVTDEDVNDGDEEDGANLFQVWETVRITQPRPWYCYARVAIEVVFFFLWPFISMLVNKNYPVALVFLMLGSFTFLWRYFDASAVLSELGSLSYVGDDTITHAQKFCLSELVGRVITNKGRRWWTWIFFIFFVAILVLTLLANGSSEDVDPQARATRRPILLVDDYYYPSLNDTLAYPTCDLTKGFEFPGGAASGLADYAFLSVMSYETSETNKYALSKWFGGPDLVVDESEFVTNWRISSNTASSPVYFKLFSLSSAPGYAIVSIRGSETVYDWIANMQLWSAAGLAQVVKWITPFGWVWEPILPDLIYLVNLVESSSIASVSYYKTTTQFVNEVLAGYGNNFGYDFSNLRVTGASLGGGLAIITGAQTDAYAVAISGPGATLSRETYDPPVESDKLNAHTFNFIPERDYVARLGGRASFFQNGECTAQKNDLFGCHFIWRSVCEIVYRCGSNSRPVECRCVTDFGYPPPLPFEDTTRSFEEACQEAINEWYDVFPPS